MKLISLVACLAVLAFAAFRGASASASQVPAYNNGDLLLGFYDYTGTITNDYLVDLGPISDFNFSHGFVISSSTTNIGTDLNTVFGSTWRTSGDIVFGLAASYPLTGQIFASNPNDVSGDNVRWSESVAQGAPASQIEAAGQAYNLSTQSHGEQNPRGLEQTDGSTNSWDTEASGGFGQFFGSGGDGAISDYVTNSLSFDEVNQASSDGTPSTELGFFSIDSSGDVTYTAAAVPEPSAYAAVVLGAIFLMKFGRRRRLA